ncbi:MAG: cyclophilin-like fold protein [Candidatus Anammoxibacter sp.]
MGRKIKISFSSCELEVELFNTPTADEIYKNIPFESKTSTWGKEVYFSTPVQVTKEADARDVVEPGELAFWVEGNSIAIGFGQTPISHGDEIRLATKTNIWATTTSDVKQLGSVKNGEIVKIERIT